MSGQKLSLRISSSFGGGVCAPGSAAAFTRMSIEPNAAAAALTKRFTSSSDEVSPTIGTTCAPVSALNSAAAAASNSSPRAITATRTPSDASRRAIALPSPLLPPVTSADLPASSSSIVKCPNLRQGLRCALRESSEYDVKGLVRTKQKAMQPRFLGMGIKPQVSQPLQQPGNRFLTLPS